MEQIYAGNNADVKLLRFPNYEIGFHKHNFYELNVIVDGEGFHYIDKKQFFTKKGDVFVVPIDVEHAYVNNNNLTVVHIIFTELFFERHNELFLSNKEHLTLFLLEPQLKQIYGIPMSFKLTDEQLKKIETFFQDFSSYQKIEGDLCIGLTDGLAITILYYLYTCFNKLYNSDNSPTSNNSTITGLVRYIVESQNNVQIKQLAEISGYSRSNFFRYFKRVMHETPGKFLMRYKITTAKKLLCETTLPLTEIGQECGFYDSSHFIRCFKKATGMSPKQYRKTFSSDKI